MSTDLLAVQLGYNNYTFHRNTDGVSHEENLTQPYHIGQTGILRRIAGHDGVLT